jgi:hypothetical protein
LTFCFFCVKAKEDAPQGNGTMPSCNTLKINQQNSANDTFFLVVLPPPSVNKTHAWDNPTRRSDNRAYITARLPVTLIQANAPQRIPQGCQA